MPRTRSRSAAVARSACVSASSRRASPSRGVPVNAVNASRASLSAITVWTSRCCAPSWRSRWTRRRVSSAVDTTRARDAISCARYSALPTADATSVANCSRRFSVPRGSGPVSDVAVSMPHTTPSTVMGAATEAVNPYSARERCVELALVVVDPRDVVSAADDVRQRVGRDRDPRPERRRTAADGDDHELDRRRRSGPASSPPPSRSCDASAATAANTCSGGSPRVTRSATRSSAACSSASSWTSARACAFASAAVTSSANSASRCSARAGSERSPELMPMAPQKRVSTKIGAAAADRSPS